MGIRDDPRWVEYSEETDRPSLLGFIDWTNKKYAGETSQLHQHEELTTEQEIFIVEELR